MAITELTDDLNIIAALDDEPNADDGLSAAQLKAKFDEAANTIKDYVNDTLIPDIGAAIADAEMHDGNIPSGGTTGQVIMKNSGADYDAGWQDIPGVSASDVPITDSGGHFDSSTVEGALRELAILRGTVAPDTATEGSIGQFFLDTAAGQLYQCTDDTSEVYTWAAVGRTTTYTGSYVGTGTYGSGNKNSLTIDEATDMVIVTGGTVGICFSRSNTAAYLFGGASSVGVYWGTTTVQWYNASAAIYQLNSSGATYYYTELRSAE